MAWQHRSQWDAEHGELCLGQADAELGTFHADRYTFTMATAGWVTIDLEGAGTGPEKLDTYLLLLYGHGSGGVERSRDDDSGGDGDARAADVLLAAGRYTIEATTASNAAVGAYRLRIGGDFAARPRPACAPPRHSRAADRPHLGPPARNRQGHRAIGRTRRARRVNRQRRRTGDPHRQPRPRRRIHRHRRLHRQRAHQHQDHGHRRRLPTQTRHDRHTHLHPTRHRQPCPMLLEKTQDLSREVRRNTSADAGFVPVAGVGRGGGEDRCLERAAAGGESIAGQQCWWENRTRTLTEPAAQTCPSGFSPDGAGCTADRASKRWVRTASAPAKFRYVPAAKSCPAGYSDDGARCESDTALTRWDRTSSAPVTSRTADAVRSCDAGFAWNDTAGKCHKTTYSDPTAPLTRLVGDPPQASCRDGYDPAAGGRCTRTTLGEPTAVPTGAGCNSDLGTLAAGSISRSATLGAGCTSLRRGDAQSPHWARRFSLRVAAASTATFTASSSAADTFVYVLTGSGTDVAEIASDDDSGTGTDAKVADVALAAGTTYTVEVTTAAANTAGAFTLTAAFTAVEAPVAISGLADTTKAGAGTVAVAAAFAVEPAAAVCTATADTPRVAPKVTVGSAAHQRTVTVTAAAPFSHTVTVTCDAPGRTATKAAVTLAAVAQQVRISGLDDSVPSRATTTGGVAYAVDVFTVEPASARCTGTANGRGAAAPQISSRGGTGTVVVRLSPGAAATVTVTCTAPGHSPGVAQALFSWAPRPQIAAVTAAFAPQDACTATASDKSEDADADVAYRCVLAQGAALVATLTAVADHATIAAAWDTDSAVAAAPAPAAAPVPVIGPDNAATGDWHLTATATLGCTADGTATATVTAGVRPATGTHTTAVHIDCQAPVRIDGLDDAAGYAKTGAAVTVAEEFTVTPADAECAAAPVGTVAVPDPARPQHRRLTAEVTVGATVTVTVACTADGYADSSQDVELSGVASDCDDPLGSVIHGVTVREGTVANDPGCVSAGRGLSGVFFARRHTFTLDAAARVTVDVSGEAGLDAYVVLYRGHDAAAAAVLRRDDNSGPSSDPRLRGVRLAAGDYTIEATTAQAQATGSYRMSVSAVYVSPVRISGLADAADAGTGAVTVSEPFTVTPAAAECTASPPAASVAAGSGRRRTVSAALDGPGSLRVTVTCTAARRGPAQADVVLTHAGALTSIAARITAGGGECTATRAPRRVDAAYRCTIGRGNTVTVAADTAATGPTLHTAWTATGGISLASPAQRGAVPLFAPDNTVAGWQRTATAQLECTANGTATAAAALPGTTAKKTARLAVTCADAVRIDGLADTADNGTGTLTVARGFTVTPADAACTADPTTATVTAGAASARTLSARVAVPGTLDVTVTCKAAGHADGVRRVALTAARPCSEHLGTLATGTVARSGAIADDGCVAKARLPRTATVFYAARRAHWAKRHTFTLNTSGWVTVSIDNAPANTEPLDTYAVLLKDDGAKGTVIARNDNRSRRRTDARLTDLFLQPGSYTIEATTKQPQTAGNYTLRVDVTVTGLKRQYDVTVDETLTIGFEAGDRVASVRSITPPTLEWSTGRTGGHNYLAVTADMAGTHRVVMTLTRPSSTAEPAQVEFNVKAACDDGLSTSTRNGHLCVRTAAQTPPTNYPEDRVTEIDRGYKYPVTLGTLWGVTRVAKDARDAYMNPSPGITRDCTPTANRLAAIMLAVPLFEVPNIENNTYLRYPARSPMALSRWDRSSVLYSNNNARPPARAFWNPGVGLWQLDDTWTAAVLALSHAERAEIHIGGRHVADYLASLLCKRPEGDIEEELKKFLDPPWLACVDKDKVPREHRCYEWSYLKLWVKATDDLHVTSYSTKYPGGTLDYRSDFSTSGGLSKLKCRWGTSSRSFPCWFYDTENEEGWMLDEDPAAATTDQSPLAAPFMSFVDDRNRFAVFPESFLNSQTTLIKSVPVNKNVRMAGNATWHADRYAGAALQVEICRVVAVEAGSVCDWVSTILNSGPHTFAKKLRDAGH
ncbi:hypothetical protein [Candidatus Poriferisodalis sp.]|uniref:hypothetical protein n=1 Tax=Candidatus Poriferisodalis sp. TaxID=3101277 RepID=UPI003B025AF2